MATITTSTQAHPTHQDERILVVKKSYLFPEGTWNGLEQVDMQEYIHLIKSRQEFLPRAQMEQDHRYKQIIPYLVFRFHNKYFLMQRKAEASEARLANKYSLGIGGHIRKEDMANDSIFEWARREFSEEINYSGSYAIKPLGILNDESNAVGQVHTGFVFLLEGDSDQISVKSELKDGTLLTLDECQTFADRMETWSQMVLEALRK